MPRNYNREEAIAKLKNLCRRKEVSQRQAIEKFREFGFRYQEAEEMVHELVINDFVDDTRYASAYIHDKLVLSKWGRIKINQKLYEAGITKQTTNFAWKRFDDDFYREILKETIDLYYPKYMPNNSWEEGQKFLKFLLNRGFENALCIEELNHKTNK